MIMQHNCLLGNKAFKFQQTEPISAQKPAVSVVEKKAFYSVCRHGCTFSYFVTKLRSFCEGVRSFCEGVRSFCEGVRSFCECVRSFCPAPFYVAFQNFHL